MLTFWDFDSLSLVALLHAAVGGIDTAGMLIINMTEITQRSIQDALSMHTHTLNRKVQQEVTYRGNSF